MTTNDGPEDPQAESRVGSVAEEAARLVEVLAAFGGGPRRATDDPPDPEDPGARARGTCTCGGQQPAACSKCPVCQVIAFVQRVSPETIDRLAEIVELAATGLRDLAVVQRSRREQHPGPSPERGGQADPDDRAGAEVHDPPDGQDAP